MSSLCFSFNAFFHMKHLDTQLYPIDLLLNIFKYYKRKQSVYSANAVNKHTLSSQNFTIGPNNITRDRKNTYMLLLHTELNVPVYQLLSS